MKSVGRIAAAAVVVLAAGCGASFDGPVAVTRGPYLQLGTPEGLVVRWRTSRPTDSRVWFEPVGSGTPEERVSSTLTNEHEVRLTGLAPATRYAYAIGTSTDLLAGPDEGHVFQTAPTPGTRAPLRVWVIGDSGTADVRASSVYAAYRAFTGEQRTDAWLMLGDNAYDSGTDREYQKAVFDMYPGLLRRTVLWPALGNHDGRRADSRTQTGPYYDSFTLPTQGEVGGLPSGTEAYYSFDLGNVHFICLDSFETDRSPGSAMLTWLAADLADTVADWIVAYWHHPPYSKGSHDSDRVADSGGRLRDMRENVLPVLEAGGVDLVLSGHSHSYERSFLIAGAYGYDGGRSTPDLESLQADGRIVDAGDGREGGDGPYGKPTERTAGRDGTVYVVAGCAGSTGGGSLDHPVMLVSFNTLGSLVLDVDGRRLDVSFLDSKGRTPDTFTMIKEE